MLKVLESLNDHDDINFSLILFDNLSNFLFFVLFLGND
ncbi:hypothetical protein CLW00_109198 [Mongoliibacter ruber]|uniref:Uncharacterized protein n=1 Tax=Mongoliibacter ruber TaxID=1750599 RepID=A0A2T0WI12_9BACT|nr:hypothetical protein CLW00_109198 [Mongoliibacter ruber]